MRGGKRVGAGRKPSIGKDNLLYEVAAGMPPARSRAGQSGLETRLAEAQEELVLRIIEHKDAIVESLMRLAQGIEVEGVDKDGETYTYSQPPDYRAATYLLDFAFGKPTQKQQVIKDTTINVIHQVQRPTPEEAAKYGDIIDVELAEEGEEETLALDEGENDAEV